MHKCYIAYKTEDQYYKDLICEHLDGKFIDNSLHDAINSENEDYIMQYIRENHLSDSTVTLFLIGKHSSEILGAEEQRYIKRELQASLYHGDGNTQNGILGIVLPSMEAAIYTGSGLCAGCNSPVFHVNVNDDTTIREFHKNYYMKEQCHYSEADRYCVLVKYDDFVNDPGLYIDRAFGKRSLRIANDVVVRPPIL